MQTSSSYAQIVSARSERIPTLRQSVTRRAKASLSQKLAARGWPEAGTELETHEHKGEFKEP
jgi:hypothetical protein